MSASIANSATPALRERLEGLRATKAKALKKIETPWRNRVGESIDRAISLAGKTQKEIWVLLGHSNGAQLNRWIAGTERPQFDALFAIEVLRQPLVIALAGLAGAGVELETVIRVRRSA